MVEPEELLYGVNSLEVVQRWKEMSGRDARETAPKLRVAREGKRFLFQHGKVETCRSHMAGVGRRGFTPNVLHGISALLYQWPELPPGTERTLAFSSWGCGCVVN